MAKLGGLLGGFWVVLLLGVVLGSAALSGSQVVELTQDTFEKEVGQSKGAFVEFFAPW